MRKGYLLASMLILILSRIKGLRSVVCAWCHCFPHKVVLIRPPNKLDANLHSTLHLKHILPGKSWPKFAMDSSQKKEQMSNEGGEDRNGAATKSHKDKIQENNENYWKDQVVDPCAHSINTNAKEKTHQAVTARECQDAEESESDSEDEYRGVGLKGLFELAAASQRLEDGKKRPSDADSILVANDDDGSKSSNAESEASDPSVILQKKRNFKTVEDEVSCDGSNSSNDEEDLLESGFKKKVKEQGVIEVDRATTTPKMWQDTSSGSMSSCPSEEFGSPSRTADKDKARESDSEEDEETMKLLYTPVFRDATNGKQAPRKIARIGEQAKRIGTKASRHEGGWLSKLLGRDF